MSDETTTTNTVKTASDGTVKIAVEKYNEMLETIANQKLSISNLNSRLTKALNEPPVIHRTNVIKTTEMLVKESKVWGSTFIGLGACLVVVGAFHVKKANNIEV